MKTKTSSPTTSPHFRVLTKHIDVDIKNSFSGILSMFTLTKLFASFLSKRTFFEKLYDYIHGMSLGIQLKKVETRFGGVMFNTPSTIITEQFYELLIDLSIVSAYAELHESRGKSTFTTGEAFSIMNELMSDDKYFDFGARTYIVFFSPNIPDGQTTHIYALYLKRVKKNHYILDYQDLVQSVQLPTGTRFVIPLQEQQQKELH